MDRSFALRTRVPEVSVRALVARTLSETEIAKRSVCHVQTGELYVRDNMHPLEHGLMSPNMGIVDDCMQKLCHTDHLPMKLSPGFSGNISLPMRVIHPPALKMLLKFLKRICFDCGALLVNLSLHQHTLFGLPLAERLNAIDKGKYRESYCPSCSLQQPKKIDQDESKDSPNRADIRLTFVDVELGRNFYTFRTPDEIHALLNKVDVVTRTFLGCYNKDVDIRSAVTNQLSVSPPQVRPTVRQNSTTPAEDDQTTLLYKILGAKHELLQALAAEAAATAAATANVLDAPTTLDRILRQGIQATPSELTDPVDLAEWINWVDHPPARTPLECQITEIRSRLQLYIFLLFTSAVKGNPQLQTRKRLTSTKERIDGKPGRIRQNVNGKRVDRSWRTTITGTTKIKSGDMGVPYTILSGVSVEEEVNAANYATLLKLVRNGPNVYPGAKYIIRPNGTRVTLAVRNADVELFIGDRVARHMLENDHMCANRQPTLHKPSQMAHRVKPVNAYAMELSLLTTEPYNADFDGDEMNGHAPITAAARAETRTLMTVANNITSPANGSVFVSCSKQDAMIALYLFTDPNLRFTYTEAMRLVGANPRISLRRLFARAGPTTEFHPYDLLSGLFPETFSLVCDCDGNPDHEIEIRCGQMIRGRITKPALMRHTHGIIHRLYHDFGGIRCLEFLDQVQAMMCEFLQIRGFSVGMEDFLYDDRTAARLRELVAEFRTNYEALNAQVNRGEFLGKGLYSAAQRYENEILNLSGQHQANVQSLVRASMDERNRLYAMILSGARGKLANCAQLIAMFGQQTESGGRIQCNFAESRTSPHFFRYDLDPEARGFIQSSFIEGLTPQEFFFSSIGARENLINTSVGTSKTGYLQRRITKFMEDLMVEYDNTVRTSDGRIVQLRFGGTGLNISRLEYVRMQLLRLTESQLRERFLARPEDLDREASLHAFWDGQHALIAELLEARRLYLERHCAIDARATQITQVECNVSFESIWHSELQLELRDRAAPVPKKRCVEMLHEYARILRERYQRLFCTNSWQQPTPLFRLLYHYFLTPLECWKHHVSVAFLERVIDRVHEHYVRSLIVPGELIGQIAGQSLGCSTTQQQLNSIHCMGGNMQMGDRLTGSKRTDEILTKDSTKFASMTVFPRFIAPTLADQQPRIARLASQLMYTKLEHVVASATIEYSPNGGVVATEQDAEIIERFLAFQRRCPTWVGTDPPKYARVNLAPKKTSIQHWCPWIVRLVLRPDQLHRLQLSTQEIHALLYQRYREDIQCIYSDTNAPVLVFRVAVRMSQLFPNKLSAPPSTHVVLEKLQKLQMNMLTNIVLCGVPGIHGVGQREITRTVLREGQFVEEPQVVLETNGSNLLQVLTRPDVDPRLTWTNDVHETFAVLGYFAARHLMIRELRQTIGQTSESNISLLVDRMMLTGIIMPVNRAGIKEHRDFTTKLSFETQSAIMTEACFGGDVDFCRAPAAQVMFAREDARFGTAAMRLYLDLSHPNACRVRSKRKREAAMSVCRPVDAATADKRVRLEATCFHPFTALFQSTKPWMYMPKLLPH